MLAAGARLLSLVEHVKPQSAPSGPARRINGRFAKGYSGNPAGHATFAARQAAARKHADVLLKALLDELGSKPSAVDYAFAQQAALMLAKANVSEKRRVYLCNQAHMIIDRLRARYPAKKRLPSLKDFGL
jgi:hypothetical protein